MLFKLPCMLKLISELSQLSGLITQQTEQLTAPITHVTTYTFFVTPRLLALVHVMDRSTVIHHMYCVPSGQGGLGLGLVNVMKN